MAYRPNPEQPTPYEELGGGIHEPWRDVDDIDQMLFTLEVPPVSHTTSPPEKKRRPRRSRRGGRGYPEEDSRLGDEPTYVERTPEELKEFHGRIADVRATYARDTAHQTGTPNFQYDEERRRALRWAAATVAEANMADGAAHILEDELDPRREGMRKYKDAEHARRLADERRITAEELVISACKKCIFIDRCELVGAETHIVRQLGDKGVRDTFVTAMSGQYGSSYVSCESIINTN